MDSALLEPIMVIIELFMVSIPAILLRHFSNNSIPKNFDEFDNHYKEDISKIEEYSIGELYKKFENAISYTQVNNEINTDEKNRDKGFIEQLIAHETFFVELGFHNIKSYKYAKIKDYYDLINSYKDNFNKFYYLAIFIAIATFIIFFFVFKIDISILIIIFIIIFYLITESIRNLYHFDTVQKKIDEVIVLIKEDIKHIPKHNLIE